MAASVAVAMVGLFLAWSWYAKGEGRVPAMLAERFPRLYRTLVNKYFVDEAYDAVFVEGLAKGGGRFLWEIDARVIDGFFVHGARNLTMGFSHVSSWFDRTFVDGAVNGVGTVDEVQQRALTALNRNGKDYPDLVPDGRIGAAARRLQDLAPLAVGPDQDAVAA